MAWNQPMGLSNCTRSLAYATAVCEQPACGAEHLGGERDRRASAAIGSMSDRRLAGAAADTSTSNTRRVESIDADADDGKAAVRRERRPSHDRRTTSTWSTRSASSTNDLVDSSLGRHTPFAPAIATVPVASPALSVVREVVTRGSRNGSASAAVAKNGPGATRRRPPRGTGTGPSAGRRRARPSRGGAPTAVGRGRVVDVRPHERRSGTAA